MKQIRIPLLSHLLYKYFGIETNRYKSYWKRYCYNMQVALESQSKYLNYKNLVS